MLVLGRKENEKIKCTTPEGRIIVITVGQIRGKSVRIGIEADKEVSIIRTEIEENDNTINIQQ